jgi:hypothetical protein
MCPDFETTINYAQALSFLANNHKGKIIVLTQHEQPNEKKRLEK